MSMISFLKLETRQEISLQTKMGSNGAPKFYELIPIKVTANELEMTAFIGAPLFEKSGPIRAERGIHVDADVLFSFEGNCFGGCPEKMVALQERGYHKTQFAFELEGKNRNLTCYIHEDDIQKLLREFINSFFWDLQAP